MFIRQIIKLWLACNEISAYSVTDKCDRGKKRVTTTVAAFNASGEEKNNM